MPEPQVPQEAEVIDADAIARTMLKTVATIQEGLDFDRIYRNYKVCGVRWRKIHATGQCVIFGVCCVAVWHSTALFLYWF